MNLKIATLTKTIKTARLIKIDFKGRFRSLLTLFLSARCSLLFIISILSFSGAVPLQHGKSLTPSVQASMDINHYFISEKLDGVRGYWDGAQLLSRQGYLITTPSWFTEGFGEIPLDGELWLGRERFQEVSALIARNDIEDPLWQEMTYQIFDLPSLAGDFETRVAAMSAHIAQLSLHNPYIKKIAQTRLSSLEMLDQSLTETVALGGEGLMLHHEASHYQAYIRHGELLKVKHVDDGCALIVGYTKGRGKYEGMVGALQVEVSIDETIQRFKIGSGLTDALRKQPPAKGRMIQYLHNGYTVKGIPRFPRLGDINSDECARY